MRPDPWPAVWTMSKVLPFIMYQGILNYIFDNVENWNGKTINVNGGGGDELFISITEHKKRGHGIETLNLKELFEIKDTLC